MLSITAMLRFWPTLPYQAVWQAAVLTVQGISDTPQHSVMQLLGTLEQQKL